MVLAQDEHAGERGGAIVCIKKLIKRKKGSFVPYEVRLIFVKLMFGIGVFVDLQMRLE